MIDLNWYDIWKDNLADYLDKHGYTLDPWWTAMYERCLKSVLILNLFGFIDDEEMARLHRVIAIRIMLESTEK